MTSATGGAIAAAAAQQLTSVPRQRSFLRSLIPFTYNGGGISCEILRQAFVRYPFLIKRFFGALEVAPLPDVPRLLFAEGFQILLEGKRPQRDIRTMFEESSMELRKELSVDGIELAQNPIVRLLGLELFVALTYYETLTSISFNPQSAAEVAARAAISSDVRGDGLLHSATLAFAALKRDVATGDRPPDEVLDVFAHELLLLERDAFGKHRLDNRGEKRFALLGIELADIAKTDETFAFLKDPVVRQHGLFQIRSSLVRQGRWEQHRVSCLDEDLRVDDALPREEMVAMVGDGWRANVRLMFDKPLCQRILVPGSSDSPRTATADAPHEEVIELAVPDQDLSFMERWFRLR